MMEKDHKRNNNTHANRFNREAFAYIEPDAYGNNAKDAPHLPNFRQG